MRGFRDWDSCIAATFTLCFSRKRSNSDSLLPIPFALGCKMLNVSSLGLLVVVGAGGPFVLSSIFEIRTLRMHLARTAVAQVADSSTRDVARADGAGILCSRSWIWLHISAGEEASFESGNRGSSPLRNESILPLQIDLKPEKPHEVRTSDVEDVLKNICWACGQMDATTSRLSSLDPYAIDVHLNRSLLEGRRCWK